MRKSMFKRLVYTPPDLSPRFTCKVNLSNTKNPVWFFRQRNATCKLAATEDYIVCFIKLDFGTVQLTIVSRTEWFARLCINLIKLRWWATGLFCLGRICFPGLIYCDRIWLLFLGIPITKLSRWKICFTLGLSNYFSLKSLSLCLKVTWMCPKVNWSVDYRLIVWFKLWIY